MQTTDPPVTYVEVVSRRKRRWLGLIVLLVLLLTGAIHT